MIDERLKEDYERDGYVVVRGLFSAEEVDSLRDHFMRMREAGSYPGEMLIDGVRVF